MQRAILALFSLVLLTTSLVQAENYPFKEPFARSLLLNAGGELTLENINGPVEILTWDKNEVRIEGEKRAQTEADLHSIELMMENSLNRIAISTRLPKQRFLWFFSRSVRAEVRYTLTVPASTNLRQIKIINGNVRIHGVQGAVEAETVNGRIEVADLLSYVRLKTVNGSIRADFPDFSGHPPLSFTTVNGSITVLLPKDAGSVVHASVVNGHIDCDFPLESTKDRITERNLRATLGNGKATLTAKTVNGSIHIRERGHAKDQPKKAM